MLLQAEKRGREQGCFSHSPNQRSLPPGALPCFLRYSKTTEKLSYYCSWVLIETVQVQHPAQGDNSRVPAERERHQTASGTEPSFLNHYPSLLKGKPLTNCACFCTALQSKRGKLLFLKLFFFVVKWAK